MEGINQNNWGITLTPKFDMEEKVFRDLIISQEDGEFHTLTYFKAVDTKPTPLSNQ